MRRLMLLIAAGSLWLFLAAIPALADGGPHVMSANSGVSSLTADGCAGCHRAHTAQAAALLKVPEEQLCGTCHGASSAGAVTDVMTGLQYAYGVDDPTTPDVDESKSRGTATLGALRGGGFDKARIGDPARFRFGTGMTNFYGKVSVGPADDVTSAHLPAIAGLTQPGIAWGNGANGSGVGPTVTLACASCHNPHGNGQYRILNPIPAPASTISGTFTPIPGIGQPILDSPVNNPDPAESDTKNYTVIQTRSPFLLYASDVSDLGYGPETGDYFHRFVPWNQAPSGNTGTDAPNGQPSSFSLQMTNWCAACHSRYLSTGGERVDPISGNTDPIYRYQHQTITSGQTACTTCHVSHGSNAIMDGQDSSTFTYPDFTTASDSSRLLKVGNRGTCQLCHDPTNSTAVGAQFPATLPGTP